MSVRPLATALLLVAVTAVPVGPALADETAVIDDESLPLAAGSQQVLQGQTTLPQGTEITVRIQSSEGTPFLRQQTVYVGHNGTFAAVFDLSPVQANTSVDLTVVHNGTTLLERDGTIAACEGDCTDTVPDIPGVPDTVVTVERGGVATIPVSTGDNGSVSFALGDSADTHLANATLTDGDGDGEVRLRVDTAARDAGGTLSVGDADDSITVTRAAPARASPIATGDLPFRVTDDGATLANGLVVVEPNESSTFDVDDAEFGFERTVHTSRQGDVTTVNITLGPLETATVSLGGPENGYQINATVRDGDGDGTVGLRFDTAAAGRSGETLRAADGDDSVVPVPGSEVQRDTYIDAGDYDLRLYDGVGATGEADAVATLSLQSSNVSTATETALAVTADRTAETTDSGLPDAGLGAIALGGVLAVGGVALVFRTLLS